MVNWDWPDSTITRVVDGDTIVARLTRDIGFNGSVSFDQRLRLNRINCQPLHTEQGALAATYVGNRIGFPVEIITVGPYKYGDEWMAEVVLVAGVNLSDALVEAGLAVFWDGKGPRPGG